eukprot:1026673-Pyramimonas_sp.AAC.1
MRGDFDAAFLSFFPKGAPDGTAEDELCHAEDELCHADNRLLARAVRMVMEGAVARQISKPQRGSLIGRSTLANL